MVQSRGKLLPLGALLGFAGALWGCDGALTGPLQQAGGDGAGGPEHASEDDPSESPTEFSCNPALAPESPALRRLTKRQYVNTLTDLLTSTLASSEDADAVLVGLATELALIREEERAEVPRDPHGSYRRLDQAVQQSHVDGWYETAVRLGELLTTEERLGVLVGSCAVDDDTANDEACLDDFIARFGRLVLRRPLADDEVAFFRGFYAPSTGIDPLGFADVIGGLFNAPQFLYHVEHAGSPVGESETTFELQAYELASRLSYHFWDSMPDEQLLGLAESGQLLEADAYELEVERLFRDARTRGTLREFFREWMKLEDLPELDTNNASPLFQAFAGENLPSPDLREAMIDEVVDLLDYYTWEEPGGIAQIFTTDLSFARSEELAALYGVAAWDGSSAPPTFPESRPGILTRAALLSTGSPNTRPVMKGVFIRRNVLCDQIPPPPENAMANPPELDEELSTRQVVEAITEQPGTGCASCHASLINPLGFATEGFDSLGRVRAMQTLFDQEGTVVGEAALDTTSVPQILLGDTAPASGPEELADLVVSSGKAAACAVRHYYRFSMGRFEGVASDGCVLEQMRGALVETGSLAGMLREVALTDAFRQRTFSFGEPAGDSGGGN